jgi:two-component system, NtrC family, response regulator HupR/HoxA
MPKSNSNPEQKSPEHTVLIVDDEIANLQKLRRALIGEYRVLEAGDAEKALEWLRKEPISAIITDQKMPGMSGVDLLEKALAIQPACMRIILTGYTDVPDLIESINTGRVYKYITKPWEPTKLLLDLREAVHHFELVQENQRLQKQLQQANEQLQTENRILRQEVAREIFPEEIVFQSESLEQILRLLEKVNPTDSTVLIQGETGTGKELLARHIHRNSLRRNQIFMAVNCGAIPRELIESEFFGHLRGAFTSATSDKRGYFEMANHGTIFLDEIGESSPELQVKLLRVLQEGEIMPVGASAPRRVDVRILASTNRDLQIEVAEGRFRQDLFYRLHVFSILVPPLRERRRDILPLAEHFIQQISRRMRKETGQLTPEARKALENYLWPGNVRELRNEMERLVILAPARESLGLPMLSDRIRIPLPRNHSAAGSGSLKAAVEQLEATMIREALEACRQNRSQTARLLGISRQNLLEKMRRNHLS